MEVEELKEKICWEKFNDVGRNNNGVSVNGGVFNGEVEEYCEEDGFVNVKLVIVLS